MNETDDAFVERMKSTKGGVPSESDVVRLRKILNREAADRIIEEAMKRTKHAESHH
jgi:hypothetical protein